MIAGLLLRFGIPAWAAKLAAYALLVAVVVTSALVYRHSLIQQGVAQESTRRDAIERRNSEAAKAELAVLTAKHLAAQAQLAAAREALDKLKEDLDHEKTDSVVQQRCLAIGACRLSVLTRQRPAGRPAEAGSTPAAGVDSGTSVVSDLDPTVAANLEWLRSQNNEAIQRLEACVGEYDAVKAAAEAH